jgi:hypothetical protein
MADVAGWFHHPATSAHPWVFNHLVISPKIYIPSSTSHSLKKEGLRDHTKNTALHGSESLLLHLLFSLLVPQHILSTFNEQGYRGIDSTKNGRRSWVVSPPSYVCSSLGFQSSRYISKNIYTIIHVSLTHSKKRGFATTPIKLPSTAAKASFFTSSFRCSSPATY